MSKSILVMDTQENCETCPLFRRNIDYIPEDYCFNGLGKREITDLRKKPDWCPIRDLPEKLEENVEDYEESYYIGGWNDCIDEILKGDKAE